MTDPTFDPGAETVAGCAGGDDDQQSPDAVAMALAVPLDPDADPGPLDDDPADDDVDDPADPDGGGVS